MASAGLRQRCRHWGALIFIGISLVVSMTVSQIASIDVGSPRYWLIILAALLVPLWDLPAIVGALFGRAILLLAFLVAAGAWHLLAGDHRAVLQLLLLIYVLSWVSTDRMTINVHDIAWLYAAMLAVGVLVLVLAPGFNEYGLIPGRTRPEFGVWRVSFFSNIAYTGMLSLAAVLILTKSAAVARSHWLVLSLAAYFLIFSFVRTAFIAMVVYLALRWWFGRYRAPAPRRMFWTALLVAIGLNLAIFLSVDLLYLLQHNPVVSRLLLRGETDITYDWIAYQLYRPWLWAVQWKIFTQSPWLMGWGAFDFAKMVIKDSPPLATGGTEALPTRLLTVYGIPALFFTMYLVVRLWYLAKVDDRWACACFAPLIIVMMNWGSIFHPTDGIFVILMLIMVRGSAAFSEPASAAALKRI